MTPVEEIRRAAALMRERAKAATPGRWMFWNDGHVGSPEHLGGIVKPTAGSNSRQWIPDAVHIASWHPAVALAVADLTECPCEKHADAVARAYLAGAS